MTTLARVKDWSYREARRRMIRAARPRLSRHTAIPSLDDDGNRLVTCRCGWRGNGIGWAGHVDTVVRAAVDEDALP